MSCIKWWKRVKGEGYKTIMGTIPKISSHSPFTTEAVYGVRLLLFWPAVIPDPKIWFYNPWLSGFACYSRTFRLSFCPFWGGLPGRSVFQALMAVPGGTGMQFQLLWGRGPFSLKPCDSVAERTFPGSLTFWTSETCVPWFRLRLAWCADPGVWLRWIWFQLRNFFRLHIFWAVFYRSPDKSNLLQDIQKTMNIWLLL